MKSLRQNLYVLNLLLVAEIFLVLFFVSLIKKNSKIKNSTKVAAAENTKSFKPLVAAMVPLRQVYGKRDIFGLGQGTNIVEEEKNLPSLNIPQLVIPEISKAPDTPVVALIDPLTITLNGIIGSSIPEASVCIIADETDKEKSYKVGDRVKDGVIIKILRDRIVILRLNGQVETHFLHEVSSLYQSIDLSSLVLNISENKYKINAEKFKQKIVNLGSMLDYFEMIPFVGEDGNVIGIVVTDKDPKNLSSLLGFKENDLILKINEISLTSNKNRIAAYDSVVNTNENAEVVVEFERDGQKQQNSYIISYKTLKEDTPTIIKKTTEINNPVASVGTSNVMFPELMAKEERERSNKLHNDNIDRIRRDLIASSIKPRIN